MNNDILFKILQLDSLTGFLNWTERIRIHLYKENKIKTTTPKILAAYEWIEIASWEAPEMKYGDDCLQYFYDPDSDTWMQAEYYLKLYPEYKAAINKIKNIKI
jgi:hypothetical protein